MIATFEAQLCIHGNLPLYTIFINLTLYYHHNFFMRGHSYSVAITYIATLLEVSHNNKYKIHFAVLVRVICMIVWPQLFLKCDHAFKKWRLYTWMGAKDPWLEFPVFYNNLCCPQFIFGRNKICFHFPVLFPHWNEGSSLKSFLPENVIVANGLAPCVVPLYYPS